MGWRLARAGTNPLWRPRELDRAEVRRSSVADAESIKRVAKRIVETRKAGNDVVVAVSAMGDTTDELLDLANEVTPHPGAARARHAALRGRAHLDGAARDGDQEHGHEARSFTGSQAGMITDATHGAARIVDVTPVRSARRSTTARSSSSRASRASTATRATSRPSAVAAVTRPRSRSPAALEADVCEIYTDVDGVFTSDPRVVKKARKLDRITSEEMLELASSGAKVLHIRAVEYARRHGVTLHVRSSFNNTRGRSSTTPRAFPKEQHWKSPSSPVSRSTSPRPRSRSSACPTSRVWPRRSSDRREHQTPTST
jgi:aspartate kinase